VEERSLLERVVEATRLLETYGGLLTSRQREVLELHYLHDLSLGEIAELLGTSRQAVHDLVRRSLTRLETYEDRLGLVARAAAAGRGRARREEAVTAAERAADAALTGLEQGDGETARRELRRALALLRQVREDLQGEGEA